MPEESTVTVSLESVSGPPSSFPVVLKKIMEIPPPNILEDGDDGKSRLRFGIYWDGSACLLGCTESRSEPSVNECGLRADILQPVRRSGL